MEYLLGVTTTEQEECMHTVVMWPESDNKERNTMPVIHQNEWTCKSVLDFLPEVACCGCDWYFERHDYRHTAITIKDRESGAKKTILFDVSIARTEEEHIAELLRLIREAGWVLPQSEMGAGA